MTNDIDIKLIGDNELAEALRAMEYATQHKYLKSILRDAGNKTIVKALKSVAPVRTGKLRDSMGVVTGKSKNNATVFVGPRLSHTKTRSGVAGYSGWVANILENAKGDDRYPKKGKAFKPFAGSAAGPAFFKRVGPIKKKTNFSYTIMSNVMAAEIRVTKATRTVLERAYKRKIKRGGLSEYAIVKGRQG